MPKDFVTRPPPPLHMVDCCSSHNNGKQLLLIPPWLITGVEYLPRLSSQIVLFFSSLCIANVASLYRSVFLMIVVLLQVGASLFVFLPPGFW